MVSRAAKRKAVGLLQEAAKRLRIETAEDFNDSRIIIDEDFEAHQVEEESGEDEFSDNIESSDDENRSSKVDSPNTPFSPSSPSRKYPSQKKSSGNTRPCDEKTIECDFKGCVKKFNRHAKLEDHLRSHFNDRAFVCSHEGCDKAYFRMPALKEHLTCVHSTKRPYICDRSDCGKSFAKAQRLQRHKETHEGHDRFRCTAHPPCSDHFRKRQTLQRHIRTAHLGLMAYPCTHVNSATGLQCEEGFELLSTLRRHENRVHGPPRFWCDECTLEANNDGTPHQVGFTTQTELSKHITNQHEAQCIFCDVKCSNQYNLEKHVEAIHSRPTPKYLDPIAERRKFSCTYPDCGKSFTKNNNLTAHVRTIHEKIRFKCITDPPNVPYKDSEVVSWDGQNSCGREFFTKQNLEEHIRTQHLQLPSLVNTKRSKPQAPPKERRRTTRFGCISESPNVPYKDPSVAHWNGVDACGIDFATKQKLEDHIRIEHLYLPPLVKLEQAKPARPRKERLRKVPQSIDVLTGAAFEFDEGRNRPCLVKACSWLFVRQYDLDQHLRTKHALSPNGTPIEDCSEFGEEFDLDDLESEIQQGAVHERVFWHGTDMRKGEGGDDDWAREQMEMRSLIDPALLGI